MVEKNVRSIIRISNTDLDGSKPVYHALCKITGIGYMFSNAILSAAGIPGNKRVGEIGEDEVKKIESIIKDPIGNGLPAWMANRRKDNQDGNDRHLISTDLRFRKDLDIKMMQKVKSYKGIRHALGQPVRGQRTKAHFRTGISVGVQRSKVKPGEQSKDKGDKR